MNYITVKDIMGKYKVSKPTVYKWIYQGMPSYKFNTLRRFIEIEVDKWINEQ